jgi:hypothetical protein
LFIFFCFLEEKNFGFFFLKKIDHQKCMKETHFFCRYIGSKREIAAFENFRQMGPIVKVVPLGTGKGAVIAILSDPNYEVS